MAGNMAPDDLTNAAEQLLVEGMRKAEAMPARSQELKDYVEKLLDAAAYLTAGRDLQPGERLSPESYRHDARRATSGSRPTSTFPRRADVIPQHVQEDKK